MVTFIKSRSSKHELVQEGLYAAQLTDVKEFSNAYGPRIGFEFTLENGSKIMRSTNVLLTEKSKLAEVINGLRHKPLTQHDLETGFDLETLIGTECQVFVSNSPSKNGTMYSNVEKILQPKAN